MQTVKTIDFGERDYPILDATGQNMTGVLYSSETRAIDEAERLDLTEYRIEYRDTRPTINEVCRQIAEAESETWDEYLSFSGQHDQGRDKWPDSYRWVSVFVVTGSSEGMYLHVEVISITGERIHMITGKTLNWGHTDNLWQSAGRIAKMIGA